MVILILTSFSNYLDKAMDISVFRYLSKPIDVDRFNRNFTEAIKRYKQISKQIIVNMADKVCSIKTKDILYIENLKYGSMIITKSNHFKTNKKLADWYKIINRPNNFVYSHKSFLINLQNVAGFDRSSIEFQTDNKILDLQSSISQRKYSELKKAFLILQEE